MLGSYIYGTEVSYGGSVYKCISVDLDLCNNVSYLPNGLLSSHVWEQINHPEIKIADKAKSSSEKKDIVYPERIGSYKEGTVVFSGSKSFRCMSKKEELCNSYRYDPVGSEAYKAWKDISLDDIKYQSENIKGVQYKYPDGIGFYIGGTQVLYNDAVYACKVGPESQLCKNLTYEPDSEYGSQVWEKIVDHDYTEYNTASVDEFEYPENIQDYGGGTVVNFEGESYMCQYGNLSRLCKSKYYSPGKTHSQKVWSKI